VTWLPAGRATAHPLVVDTYEVQDGVLVPDKSRTAEVYQLRPDTVDAFVVWTGGTYDLVNGGPVVLLPGRGPALGRVVGLGDFAVREGEKLSGERADGFWQRWQIAEPD
jgi:hypothetical protein